MIRKIKVLKGCSTRKISFGNEKGFTLLEVLIADVILGVGLLMLANFQYIALQGNGTGYKMSEGVVITEDVLEQLKIRSTSTDPALTPGTHTSVTDPAILSNVTSNGVVYTRSYSVTASVSATTIMMTTVWNDHGPHTVTMTTIVRNS
ncbi:MAG: type IV pilus modification PilV family protein [Nitrospiria bacterium]